MEVRGTESSCTAASCSADGVFRLMLNPRFIENVHRNWPLACLERRDYTSPQLHVIFFEDLV